MTYKSYFKQEFSFQTRISESYRVLAKYPDRIPIICEKYSGQTDLPDIGKKKFLVPNDITIGHFIQVIRHKMKLKPEDSIFLFVKDRIITNSAIIGHIYDYLKDDDGFLYIQYTKENTFG